MTGFHGLHVIGGLLFMVAVIWMVSGRTSRAPVGPTVEVCAYYWHFVDVVWVVMFANLYLLQMTTGSRRPAIRSLTVAQVAVVGAGRVWLVRGRRLDAADTGRQRARPADELYVHRLLELSRRRRHGRHARRR